MEGILIHFIDLVCSDSFYLCTVLLLSYTFVKIWIYWEWRSEVHMDLEE